MGRKEGEERGTDGKREERGEREERRDSETVKFPCTDILKHWYQYLPSGCGDLDVREIWVDGRAVGRWRCEGVRWGRL